MKTLQYVQRETFLPYGEVLEFPAGIEETFCIITTEEKEPWRLAVFRYTNKEIQRMECHPTSRESFEPLHGLTVLVVATHENPEEYEAFILDKPVCLKKGIWHQVLALTEEAQVKIVENLEVRFGRIDTAKKTDTVEKAL